MARARKRTEAFVLDPTWRSLDAWKTAARVVAQRSARLLSGRGAAQGEVLSREARDGFDLEVVNLSATPAYQIPARVLIPKNRRAKLPAVLALHCHSGRYTWVTKKFSPRR